MMLVPYFLLTLKSFGYLSGLGANPVETIIHETGLWGLRFLMLTLLLTPIAYYSKIPSINKLGKPVGLMAFFYLLNHFLTYAMIDQAGDLGVIIVDIIETPYLIVGWGGFLCLLGVVVLVQVLSAFSQHCFSLHLWFVLLSFAALLFFAFLLGYAAAALPLCMLSHPTWWGRAGVI